MQRTPHWTVCLVMLHRESCFRQELAVVPQTTRYAQFEFKSSKFTCYFSLSVGKAGILRGRSYRRAGGFYQKVTGLFQQTG